MTFTPRKIYDATGATYFVAAQPLPADQGDAQVVLLVDASGNPIDFSTVGSGGLTDAELRATPVPVTANAGTGFTSAVLTGDAIGAATDLLAVAVKDGSGNAQPLAQPLTATELGTAALATSAKQDTLIGHVDGVEGALTTLNAKDFATSAKQDTLIAKDFATQTTLAALNTKVTACNTGAVVISGSLPAGSAAIGKLASNAGVTIGNVGLVAGSAIVGQVSINQTTDGTTNKVSATQGTAANLNAQVVGSVAHDGVDAGNPVKCGGQARTTNPAAVADADRANFITDKLGKQITVGAIRELKGVQQTTITSSTTETTIVTAVASTFLDLYGLIITNTSATVTKVTIKDSTTGTTRMVIEVPPTDTRGFTVPVDSAIPQATANNNWTATCGTSVASVEITALYVKNL